MFIILCVLVRDSATAACCSTTVPVSGKSQPRLVLKLVLNVGSEASVYT